MAFYYDNAPEAADCFARGTCIATPGGSVPAASLSVGDSVILASGEIAPVTWIGRRRVDCRRHPQPQTVRPVRIRRGAFAEDLPCRDLLLSPDHAVFAAGVLIPIRFLINSRTIVQERWDRVSYFHVELPRHGILLAEGLAVESYLDAGGRGAFQNGGPVLHLHPDFEATRWETEGCAPLAATGPAFQRAARTLRFRARYMRRPASGTNVPFGG